MLVFTGLTLVALTAAVAYLRWHDASERLQWLGVLVAVWGGFVFRSVDKGHHGAAFWTYVPVAIGSLLLVVRGIAFRRRANG